ncbi:MAG: SCO family protein [Vicinamibacterales bacterium]
MNRRELFTSLGGRRAPAEPCMTISGPARFTNALLRTHEGKQVRFYDDLIQGRQVVVNMMYADCEGVCPLVTSRLVQVHEALKARMGRDVFMYSITLKPEVDDPAALKAFAAMHGALLPGWTFLTGDPYDIETIRFRLFRLNHIKFDTDIASHTAMLRIINDATNCWTCVPPLASLYTVLQHIGWADPPKSFRERLAENRRLQQQINEEVAKYGYRKIV